VNTVPEPVISLTQVSVRYRRPTERIASLKEYAIRWLQGRLQHAEFWALRDVSLEVGAGEVFGIVGPNGAGKSTLLKVVARVLRPTEGRVRLRGRVAPLLELGAGFDTELTGRENVYLNAVTLGYAEADVARRFERIVQYAGLTEFIDAPLRTYSTGMVARLGFAIATDVQPEVLIVDEVLSVGDERFRKQSAERIQRFCQNGSTVLLVTHNLDAVVNLCRQAIWLDHGVLKARGPAAEIVEQYRASGVAERPAWRRP
jgi:ABC-2 type transport system ATP-binding protein/lipopolysaccharide transport system ATP-binding protein